MTSEIRKIQKRRDDAATWTSENPTLLEGEHGIELDTGKVKYGDGSTAWNSLGYWPPNGILGVKAINELRTLATPSGFPVTPLIRPMKTARGWRGHVGALSLKPTITGTTYYVDSQKGSNASAGTSAAPFKSIYYALQQADVGVVKVAPGLYRKNDYFGVPTFTIGATAAYSVERWPVRSGPVISCPAEEGLTWTATGTAYYATLSGIEVLNVVDISVTLPDSSFMRYQKCASLAQVQAQPGSFWHDTGTTTLYIRPFHAGVPGDNVLCMRGFNGAVDATSSRREVFLDSITFIGGAAGITLLNNTTVAGGKVVARNCRFISSVTGGAQIQGIDEVVFEDCVFSGNAGDGLSLAIATGSIATTNGVAVNCVAENNGDANLPDTVNGFTSHELAVLTLINCSAAYNVGPNFAHVDADNYVWSVGCEAGPSAGISTASVNKDCGFLHYTGSEGWMYECVSTTSRNDAVVDGSSIMRLDRCSLTTTSGTTTTYEQA